MYAIDFGTSNSLLASSQSGPIELDPKHFDPTILRSLMYFPKKGEASFGQDAIQNYTKEAGEGRFIRSIKKYLPAKSFTATEVAGKMYTLEELISRFLKEMKNRADNHFGKETTSVVLGRPAKFAVDDESDQLAQDRLEKAARMAGFTDIEFLAEPLAAAYGYRQELEGEKLLLVVDLGGGTSDFTVIRISPSESEVLSLGGISVAGDVLDGTIMVNKIAPHLGSEVQYRLPMSSNILQMPKLLKYKLMSPADITLMSRSDIIHFLQQVSKSALGGEDRDKLEQLFVLIQENLGFAIFEEIEKCKKQACEHQLGVFSFEKSDVEIQEALKYPDFVEFAGDKIGSIFSTMEDTLKMAGVSFADIDSICCTGGTSKVPAIRDGLEERFGSEKISTFKNFHSVIQGLSEKAKEL